tara:strand:+ start:71 stop:460 length:390 start_codon:yes stop_codon:yes gene_type:complete
MDWLGFNVKHTYSLCIYFWKLVFALTVIPVSLGVVALTVLTFVIGVVTLPLHMTSLIDLKLLPEVTSVLLLASGSVGWVVLICFLSDVLSTYTYRNLKARRNSTTSPNVFIEYIKAKKQEVCPIIDYTE